MTPQYNFQKYAILCDTWQQMLHLASIAERQGINPYWFGQGDHTFENGYCYFMLCTGTLIPPNHFSNYKEWDIEDETPTTYTTFINSHPDHRVEGC